jgi:MerR family transcriptional regulator/heat shock protein HspR
MMNEDKEPRYGISIAARMVGVHAHTLRYYESVGIIEPYRSRGNIRLYSDSDIARLRQARTLMEDLGVNLAGVEVILRMLRRMAELQNRLENTEADLKRLMEVDDETGEVY